MFLYHRLMVETFLCNNTFQFMLMNSIKLTGCPLILTIFCRNIPPKKQECRYFMFLYFISQQIGNSKIIMIKYNQNCMKNIIPKSQLFPKNFTLLKLSNTLRSLECYCIYTVPSTSSCCNKTFNVESIGICLYTVWLFNLQVL